MTHSWSRILNFRLGQTISVIVTWFTSAKACLYDSISICNVLQEARIAGCVTSDEAYQFIEQKRTKEAEQGNCKESGQIGTSGKKESFPSIKDAPSAIQAITKTLEEWDISDFEGAELLSESVRNISPLVFYHFIFLFMLLFLY